MSATTHHLPSKVGVLVGEETTHGTEASTIAIIPGRSVVFAESVSENYIEVYDPANGQALQEVVQGAKDVGGNLNYYMTDFRWLYWTLGSDSMDEIEITSESGGTIAATDTITGQTSGATATVSSRSSDTLTLTSISGSFQHGETISNGTVTAVIQAFIHDISLGDYPVSLTVENIFDQLSESEKYLGMRTSEVTMASVRGEIVTIDQTLIGLTEETETTSPSTRQAQTKTPYIWSKGSIVINSVNYDDVCDSINLKISRNCVARGGHNKDPSIVVPTTFKVEVSFDMDLPSSAIRTLRRAGTKVDMTLTYIKTASDDQATLTLSNVQIISDVRDTSRDAETVRVTAVANTGTITGRVYDDIFDYSTA